MEHTFDFRRRINGRGCAASVRLDAKQSASGLDVEFSAFFDKEWTTAVGLGINYFYDHISKTRHHGLEILVVDVCGHRPDIFEEVVVYATIKCLCEIFEVDAPLVKFMDVGAFVFVG